jgi:hypothetical protein
MAIKRPDEYEHSNSDLSVVDADNVRGSTKIVANQADMLAFPVDKLKEGSKIKYKVDSDFLEWELIDLSDVTNIASWKQLEKVLSVAGRVGDVTLDLDDVSDSATRKALTTGAQTIQGNKELSGQVKIINGTSFKAKISDTSSHVIAIIDSSSHADAGGLAIKTGDDNDDESALYILNHLDEVVFKILGKSGRLISQANITAFSFTGNGEGITNVNAAKLGGLASSDYVRSTGSVNEVLSGIKEFSDKVLIGTSAPISNEVLSVKKSFVVDGTPLVAFFDALGTGGAITSGVLYNTVMRSIYSGSDTIQSIINVNNIARYTGTGEITGSIIACYNQADYISVSSSNPIGSFNSAHNSGTIRGIGSSVINQAYNTLSSLDINNPDINIEWVASVYASLKLINGTITNVVVNYLNLEGSISGTDADVNITNLYYIYAPDTEAYTVTGEAYFIKSSVPLPSLFSGAITAPSFIGSGEQIENVNAKTLNQVSAKSIAFGESYIQNYRSRLLDEGYTYFPNSSAYNYALSKELNIHNKASIMIAPSGVKTSLLPAIKGLPLDFSRNCPATYFDEDGVMQTALANVARVTYDENGDESILLEQQSTNLVTYSNDFTVNNWQKSNISLGATKTIKNVQLTEIIENSNNNFHALLSNVQINVTNATTYSMSAYVSKGVGIREFYLRFTNTFNSSYLFIDLQNGTILNALGTIFNAKIENLGDDLFRISASCTSNSAGASRFDFGIGTASYLGDGVSSIYLGNIQIEQQSSATSHIKTTGSTVTRLADTASKTGLVSYINSTEGVFYAKIAANSNNLTFRYIALSDGTNNNCVRFGYRTDSNVIYTEIRVGGVTQFFSSFTSTDITQFSSIAMRFKENDYAFFVNGVKIAFDTSAIIFASGVLTKLSFNGSDGGSAFFGKTKDLKVYTTILTDEELITLTTL